MQTPDCYPIVERFFEALRLLRAIKEIRGKKTFTDRYGINRWNMNTVEAHPESDMFQVAWLTYLVNDYNVSATWLLTGKGEVFTKKKLNDKAAYAIPAGQSEGGDERETQISGEVEQGDSGIFSRIPGGYIEMEHRNTAV